MNFWEITFEDIQDIVSEHIKKNREITQDYGYSVIYNAWPDDYSNNLNEIAVKGRVIFKSYPFYDHEYKSDPIIDPTWLDVCLLANDMINETEDRHHVFLESIVKEEPFNIDEEGFILLYHFSMGS